MKTAEPLVLKLTDITCSFGAVTAIKSVSLEIRRGEVVGLGGLLGAVYVFVALEAVRTLGASGLTAVVITGQLAISVAIDRFGLLGVQRTPITASRIAGLVLLVAGVALVVRKP